MDYKGQSVHVQVGDADVAVTRSGRSRPIVAKILGCEKDAAGAMQTLWLDRVVHRAGETFVGWETAGAISTVLRRIPQLK